MRYIKDRAVIGFLIGTFLGSGAIWQWNNLRIERSKLQLESATILSELRRELSDIQYEIYKTTEDWRRYNFMEDNVSGSETEIKLTQLDRRILLLIGDFDIKEKRLAELESREPREIELDFRGPGRPGRPSF